MQCNEVVNLEIALHFYFYWPITPEYNNHTKLIACANSIGLYFYIWLIRRMKLSSKLVFSFSIAACLVALVGYVGHQLLAETEEKSDIITKQISPVVNALQDIRYYSQVTISDSSEMLMHAAMANNMEPSEHDKEFQRVKENIHKHISALQNAASKYHRLIQRHFPDELESGDEISDITQQISNLAKSILQIDNSNISNQKIILLHASLLKMNKGVADVVQRTVVHEQNELDDHHKNIESLLDLSLNKSVAATAVSFLIIIFLWGFVSKKVSRPLVALRNATAGISKRAFDTRIEVVSNDEIGDLAKAFNEMSEQLGQTTVSKDYVESILRSMADALFVLDTNGDISHVNRSALQLLGYSKKEVIDKNIVDIIPEMKKDNELLNSLMEQEFTNPREAHIKPKEGDALCIYLTCSQLHNADGNLQGLVLLAQDLSARKEAEERLHYLANYDPLTGLSNRAMLFERLANAISQPISDRRNVGLLLFGIDRFKVINDTLGHKSGDQLLKIVAQRLQSAAESSDTVARIGGDEFAMVLPSIVDLDNITSMAKRVIDLVSGPIELPGHEVFTTLSLGISLYPFDGIDPLSLLKSADIALCSAKDKGKNQFMYYADVSGIKSVDHLKLESDLQHAIERDELRVYYQPQVDIEHRKITGCEALIRWEHPQRGMLSPAQFLPAAEETGLIVALGEWVLRTACAQAKTWIDSIHPDFKVAINLSDQEFKRADLLSLVKDVLEESQLPPDKLELEITENIVMLNPRSAESIMRGIRDMGIELSIDDFGTGYSSLSHLKHFPINTIKIDRSFIIDVVHNKDDRAIVEAILAIARKMDLNVIAEGVEDTKQQNFLRANGCFNIQGFLYSPPLPSENFTALLSNQEEIFLNLDS